MSIFAGAGIFVQSITVTKGEDAKEEHYFQCNRWLDDHMQDGKTETQIPLLGEQSNHFLSPRVISFMKTFYV